MFWEELLMVLLMLESEQELQALLKIIGLDLLEIQGELVLELENLFYMFGLAIEKSLTMLDHILIIGNYLHQIEIIC